MFHHGENILFLQIGQMVGYAKLVTGGHAKFLPGEELVGGARCRGENVMVRPQAAPSRSRETFINLTYLCFLNLML